ncbi:metal-sulfur cluster assembly factor [candidate division KSB1 bacterium]|nr:metal-sulfur cluster assembly factor [candidate division KSB1 bacterium]
MSSIDTIKIWQALGEVMDPELPISILDMGLIYDVRTNSRGVEIDLTFTAIACPAMTMIIDDVREKLEALPGVGSAQVNVVWNPPWTKTRLTMQGREVLQSLGIAV